MDGTSLDPILLCHTLLICYVVTERTRIMKNCLLSLSHSFLVGHFTIVSSGVCDCRICKFHTSIPAASAL